jgi:hypothetical protein
MYQCSGTGSAGSVGLPDPHPDLLVRGTDPRIRNLTKMSLLRSTAKNKGYCTALNLKIILQCRVVINHSRKKDEKAMLLFAAKTITVFHLCSVADPDPEPGSGAFLTPESGIEKSGSGSWMNIPDHFSGS